MLDGSAIAYRSHFAFSSNPLTNKEGMETGACFGFTNTLLKILDQEKPDFIAVTFDSPEKTFRHKVFEDYKATREKMPEELQAQLPYIRKIVEAFNIPFIVMPGFEADDIMGTFAVQAASLGTSSYLVTGDKDFLQLLNDQIFIYQLKKGSDVEILGAAASEKKWGVQAQHVTDMLALMGDSSDNVPGVPGIGEKTASKLIQTYGGLTSIYDQLDQVKPEKVQGKLREFKDQAFLCKELVTIHTNIPVELHLDDLRVQSMDPEKITPLFAELGFHSLIKSFSSRLLRNPSKKTKTSAPIYSTSSKPTVSASSLSHTKAHYVRIQTHEQLHEMSKLLGKQSHVVIDTETTGLDTIASRMVGFSFCFRPEDAYFVHFPSADFSPSECWEVFAPIMSNPSIHKIGQNIKFDAHIFRNEGIELKGIAFDTMLASYLLKPNTHQHGLDALSLEYLNVKKIPTEELIGKGKKQISMVEVDKEKLTEYACEDAWATYMLYVYFESELQKQQLDKVLSTIEVPLIEVLLSMERRGFHLDKKALAVLSKTLSSNLIDLTKKIHQLAGEEFNIKSPKQLGPILFEKIKIQNEPHVSVRKVKTTKTGYSTDQETLEEYLPNPLVEALLDYRNQSKLLSTYIDALPKMIHSDTQNIHTSFNQTVASTGRLSSSDPNLQNIPIRNPLGLEIRKSFIPKEKGWKILSADYSQVELRILAHLANDQTMIEAFQKNIDIHTQTASLIFDIPFENVTKQQRGQAKTINFGIIYGMGSRRLAKENGISLDEAKAFIENYFHTYSSVKDYFAQQISMAKKNGYVQTMFGRKRPVGEINSKNPRMASMAERIVTNAPIQGTAADIIKVAMIDIHNELMEKEYQSQMLLQVHDELVFEGPESELEKLSAMVKTKMESAAKLSVPLLVEVGMGDNWAQAH
ncbi:MAG: DNA polymerase I [Bdellovibrionota bacterium]